MQILLHREMIKQMLNNNYYKIQIPLFLALSFVFLPLFFSTIGSTYEGHLFEKLINDKN